MRSSRSTYHSKENSSKTSSRGVGVVTSTFTLFKPASLITDMSINISGTLLEMPSENQIMLKQVTNSFLYLREVKNNHFGETLDFLISTSGNVSQTITDNYSNGE